MHVQITIYPDDEDGMPDEARALSIRRTFTNVERMRDPRAIVRLVVQEMVDNIMAYCD